MSDTFVDTNVLLDVAVNSPQFFDWSSQVLETASLAGRLVTNRVVYAELCGGFSSSGLVDELLSNLDVMLLIPSNGALFNASRAFKSYKSRGGTRTGVLPDFFIGAHAQTLNIPLITRDVARYRTYFPTLQLIAPPS
jgi:predicted nucleic acid-binding protein